MIFPPILLVSSHQSYFHLFYLYQNHYLILLLATAIIITFFLISASFVLMVFPFLMTPLQIHHNHAIKPLVNTMRISLEIVQLTLWFLSGILFQKKSGHYDFEHTKPDTAPIAIWNIGLYFSIATT